MKDAQVNQSQELAGESSETLRVAEADGQACVAGRELDMLIAERVMGYRWREVHKRKRELCAPSGKVVAIREGKETRFIGLMWSKPELPEFSTDIADAMKVRDRIRDTWKFSQHRLFVIELIEIVSQRVAGTLGVKLADSSVMMNFTAEDICHAALRAFED